jgi:HD-GYP domain-containing protein (c-di-GMP phosphodiesterase class II)
VAEYVALQLDYDANEAKRFYLAGLLHDLGKLIVSNEIIEKEGPLTEAEYDLIKQHSYYSQKVIMKIEGFKDIATLIGEHHERLDGSGYPNQLIGDEIKLPSRILQISDVFSALTEHRPYRHSLDNEEVISKMRSMTTLNQLDAHLMHLLENHVVHLRSLIDVKLVNVQDKKNTFFYDS